MNITSHLNANRDIETFCLTALTHKMKQASEVLHNQVEKRSFFQQVMQGSISKEKYAQYMANLACIYDALESALEANCQHKSLEPLCIRGLYRSNKIAQDLKALQADSLSPSLAAQKHAAYLNDLKNTKPHLLIAHAYSRYLGDLYGGQYIGEAIDALWGDACTAFYNYAELMEDEPMESLAQYANTYRQKLDALPITMAEEEEIVAEAIQAFQLADNMLAEFG